MCYKGHTSGDKGLVSDFSTKNLGPRPLRSSKSLCRGWDPKSRPIDSTDDKLPVDCVPFHREISGTL